MEAVETSEGSKCLTSINEQGIVHQPIVPQLMTSVNLFFNLQCTLPTKYGGSIFGR